MKYTKPEITATCAASAAIQATMVKSGLNFDGIQPSNPAYEADE